MYFLIFLKHMWHTVLWFLKANGKSYLTVVICTRTSTSNTGIVPLFRKILHRLELFSKNVMEGKKAAFSIYCGVQSFSCISVFIGFKYFLHSTFLQSHDCQQQRNLRNFTCSRCLRPSSSSGSVGMFPMPGAAVTGV